ncbi:MAG: glycosyl transferase [Candidatus Aminicenantales bacterium]
MNYFCTYFDRNYLPRGLALYRSLRKHCSEFRLWVLCMDEATHEVLTQLKLPEVELIALKDFERNDESLRSAKQNRSQVEYYFTCTPSLPLYVLNHWPEVDLITYLDADLFFFSDPGPLFAELGTGSIAIIGHRFPPRLRQYREKYGIYNVGWLSFRRNEHALACLNWWREQCIAWCYDREEEDRFADQKYLDDWPIRFHNVVVLEHKGANLARWNLANYRIDFRNGKCWVDEDPLIFFHFQGFRQVMRGMYDPGLWCYQIRPSLQMLNGLYFPYIKALREIAPERSLQSLRYKKKKTGLLRKAKSTAGRVLHIGRGILARRYFYVLDNRIIM